VAAQQQQAAAQQMAAQQMAAQQVAAQQQAVAQQQAAAQQAEAARMHAAAETARAQAAVHGTLQAAREEARQQQQQLHESSEAQPQMTRRLTWQEHLVGWQIQAEQYTSGAIVGGQVRTWDPQRQLFVLAFDNGSVEPAYLPQSSVKIVDARGTLLDWESFFHYCRSVGIALDGDYDYNAGAPSCASSVEVPAAQQEPPPPALESQQPPVGLPPELNPTRLDMAATTNPAQQRLSTFADDSDSLPPPPPLPP